MALELDLCLNYISGDNINYPIIKTHDHHLNNKMTIITIIMTVIIIINVCVGVGVCTCVGVCVFVTCADKSLCGLIETGPLSLAWYSIYLKNISH